MDKTERRKREKKNLRKQEALQGKTSRVIEKEKTQIKGIQESSKEEAGLPFKGELLGLQIRDLVTHRMWVKNTRTRTTRYVRPALALLTWS